MFHSPRRANYFNHLALLKIGLVRDEPDIDRTRAVLPFWKCLAPGGGGGLKSPTSDPHLGPPLIWRYGPHVAPYLLVCSLGAEVIGQIGV